MAMAAATVCVFVLFLSLSSQSLLSHHRHPLDLVQGQGVDSEGGWLLGLGGVDSERPLLRSVPRLLLVAASAPASELLQRRRRAHQANLVLSGKQKNGES